MHGIHVFHQREDEMVYMYFREDGIYGRYTLERVSMSSLYCIQTRQLPGTSSTGQQSESRLMKTSTLIVFRITFLFRNRKLSQVQSFTVYNYKGFDIYFSQHDANIFLPFVLMFNIC